MLMVKNAYKLNVKTIRESMSMEKTVMKLLMGLKVFMSVDLNVSGMHFLMIII